MLTAHLLLSCSIATLAGAQEGHAIQTAPGPVPADVFHPEGTAPVGDTARGGRVVLHLASRPPGLNYMLNGPAVARQLLNELHEPLIRRDWETWEWRGVLAESWEVEDGPAGPRTVWTFRLRDGVKWHDGHPLDAGDVVFTWSLWKNPEVRCDRRRYMFDKLVRAERVGARTVRFHFDRPYFMAASVFDESFTVLPAHLYDLRDPDNPGRDPDASDEQQARYVNDHPGNVDWIGLGPYRLETWDTQYVEARRFEDYFDPESGGGVDVVRWRILPDADVAMRALLEGELDFFDRVPSADYFGGRTADEAFTERFYKGYYFTPYMGYTAWNVKRPQLEDPRVRRALGLCFDWEGFIRGYYHGLAFRVTGDQWYASPTCDRSLEPLSFDLEGARELLTEAGWYDRDGDGRVDRDGVPLEIDLLMPAGNEVSETSGQLYQEQLAEVGVRLNLVPLEFATLSQRVLGRDFDALSLGMVLAFESDPEQLWHSRWSEGRSSNRSGIADEEVDRLIEAIQVELDDGRRTELFHRLQARVYELQPFLFGVAAPRRFAMARRVRGFQIFALDPGYSIRRWRVAAP